MSNSNIAVTTTIAALAAALGFGLGGMVTQHDVSVSSPDVTAQYAKLNIDSNILPIANSPVKGGVNANATVVIFGDFTTPATQYVLREGLDDLFKTHGEKVAVVYKYYPLKSNNAKDGEPESMTRAKAAAAAQSFGKFWDYAAKMVATKDDKAFDENAAVQIALDLKINAKAFLEAMNSDDTKKKLEADAVLAKKLGVKAAPAIIVNGKAIEFKGNVTKDALLQAVSDEVARIDNLPHRNYLISTMIAGNASDAADASTDALGRPARGAKNAIVTIVEYSDYQCPFCAKVEPTLAEVLKNYPDTVRIVFNHNPLAMHKDAKLAHQAAYAAGLQGKFWEMHDTLFKNQKNLKEDDLVGYAKSLGLDLNKFRADLKAPGTVAAIEKALKIGEDNDIKGTPNFSINGMPLKGAVPYEQFKAKIDEAIANARKVQKETGLEGEKLYNELVKRNAPKPPARQMVEFSGAPALGPENAPIILIEFTDFQCPFCKRANDTVHELMKNNPDTIRLLRQAGYRGFLIGETFMKAKDPGEAFRDFIAQIVL